MKALAAAGFVKEPISAMSAPPTKALLPSPVRTMHMRSALRCVRSLRVFGSRFRRCVFRLLSLLGLEIVTVATWPFARRVSCVKMVPRFLAAILGTIGDYMRNGYLFTSGFAYELIDSGIISQFRNF